MRTSLVLGIVGAMGILLCASSLVATERAAPALEVTPIVSGPLPAEKPLVQIGILLDTSGSMSGLIDQARTELWSIVNEFIFARRNGTAPEVQVALYEYGKSSLAQDEGYIRQIVPLTTDLDKISEELFALKTNGGSEYCGWVIKDATEGLAWSESPDDLKVIFIAGNEPFTQGRVDYRGACKAAVAKGIIVNTIHCGTEQQGIDGKWKDGAVIADGRHLNIDHNRQVVHIPAPQDTEIAELGVKLNQTYVAYGRKGEMARERQSVQDKNAAQASAEAAVQRAVTKSSSNYVNTGWDLIDAVQTEQVKVEGLAEEELPENMRRMDADQRKAYVEAKAKERAEIQTRIQKLNEQRRDFLAEEMKKRQAEGKDTLGSAVQQAIREQAQKKNYTFNDPENTAQKSAETSKKEDGGE